jgi:hypothetical protein
MDAAMPPAETKRPGLVENSIGIAYDGKMSTSEILDELPKLTPNDLQRVYSRILELEDVQEIEETPGLLSAIDDGLRSLANEPTHTLDEARAKIAQWTSKSS